jgi:hypothetical protein
MSNNPISQRRRVHAIVPRSLLAYAGVGLGLGVVPFSIASVGCDGSTSIGIAPAVYDSGPEGSEEGGDADAMSIGIRPAMDFDADTDGGDPDVMSIGIRPAMDFDADTDGDSVDASETTADDASVDAGAGVDP